jgi:hypothetical protein
MPIIVFGQTKSKFYKLSNGVTKGLKVASIKEKDKVILVFRISNDVDFDIKTGDFATIDFKDNSQTALKCDKPSSYHSQHSGSDRYYNAAYFTLDKAQENELANNIIRRITIAGITFDISDTNSDAILKCIK